MSNYNRVILMGNLTRNPELSYTPNGKAVAKFMIAVNSSHKNKAGDKVEEAEFVPVTVWDKQAETVAEWLSKGSPVLLEGRIKQERWVSKDNENRSRLVVVANAVRFIGTKKDKKTTQDEPPVHDENAQDVDDDIKHLDDNKKKSEHAPAEDGSVPF